MSASAPQQLDTHMGSVAWSELPLPSVLTLVDAVGIERLAHSERPRVYRCCGAGGTKLGGTWGPMLLLSSSDSTIPESRGRYFSNLDVAGENLERGDGVPCITLMVCEETIEELSHPKQVSGPISRECTKLLLLKNRSSAPSSSIASISTLTGAKSLPPSLDISPISASRKATNSEVGEEGAVCDAELLQYRFCQICEGKASPDQHNYVEKRLVNVQRPAAVSGVQVYRIHE
jgi:hypothetical protein